MLKAGATLPGALANGALQAVNQASAFQLVLPAGAYILGIIINNKTANAITGGLKAGTTAGAVDVLTAQTVGANLLGQVLDAAILKRTFSRSGSQTLFFDAVVAWNGAIIDIYIPYIVWPQ